MCFELDILVGHMFETPAAPLTLLHCTLVCRATPVGNRWCWRRIGFLNQAKNMKLKYETYWMMNFRNILNDQYQKYIEWPISEIYWNIIIRKVWHLLRRNNILPKSFFSSTKVEQRSGVNFHPNNFHGQCSKKLNPFSTNIFYF